MEDVFLTADQEIDFDDLLRGITIRSLNLDIKGSDHVSVGQGVADGRTDISIAAYYENRYREYQNFAAEKDVLAELDPNILGEIFKGDSFFNLEDRPDVPSESSEEKVVELSDDMVTNSSDVKVEVDSSSSEAEDAVDLVDASSKTNKSKLHENSKEKQPKINKKSAVEVEAVREQEEENEDVFTPRLLRAIFKDQERERRIKRKEDKLKVKGKIKKMELELLDLKREQYKVLMKAQKAKKMKKEKKDGKPEEQIVRARIDSEATDKVSVSVSDSDD